MVVRRAFVLGKRDRGAHTVVLVRIANGRVLGPWTLKTIVSRN